ncbi:hypothetical protein SAM9427_36750 (plasmid) [Streptomyces sp. ETH9427]|uniref:hypothetical protein n=1 Tax=Streptomyces sp. E1N211 TaxID=1851876 RepID=UPI000E0AFE49|nr:hypothetical protein [Streptomyces sp. E1N211]AXI91321.1 hypothetical protein SAM9427_36750 [Streptomyces sp. ETH9427]
MMVTGTLEDGSAYKVRIPGPGGAPVAGSRRVRAMVEQLAGSPVLLGPLGPRRDLDPKDSAAVLALLRRETSVAEVRR